MGHDHQVGMPPPITSRAPRAACPCVFIHSGGMVPCCWSNRTL
jgi:hypothetical protein